VSDDPRDIHRAPNRKTADFVLKSPDSEELSTAPDKKASTVSQPAPAGPAPAGLTDPAAAAIDDEPDDTGDLASEALRSARAIATGRTGGRPTSRYVRRRRRSADSAAGGYSGARPDERDPMPIGALDGRSLTELGWVGPLAEARLLGHWASVVGPEIASRCQPVSLLDGELRIAAESTAWATQLRLMAPQLLARICREMPAGTVRKLAISGPSGPSWKRGPWSMRGGRGVRDTYG
jgi:predicted nucleic acid-binding Zn ribbon protein